MTTQELLAAYAAGERNFKKTVISTWQKKADLHGANLSGADFTGASLYSVNL